MTIGILFKMGTFCSDGGSTFSYIVMSKTLQHVATTNCVMYNFAASSLITSSCFQVKKKITSFLALGRVDVQADSK